MCIINLTPSKAIDHFILKTPYFNNNSAPFYGVFILSKCIESIIHIKKKYAFLCVRQTIDISNIEILYAMNTATLFNLNQALTRFEEAITTQ
jgi:hypothetical protein